jgi:hypothetical protein
MPDGGYDPQLGSNYMMDGFDFDSEYGEGVDSARKDPSPELPRSTRGLAALPDGLMGVDPGEEFDFSIVEGGDEHGLGNLGEMFKEAAPLMDLNWLESATQDPERLPEAVNPIEHSLSDLYHQTEFSDVPGSGTRAELEQAWGVDRRTDGQNLVPNVEYPRPAKPLTSALPGTDQWRAVVAHAMRKSAFGDDLDGVLREVVAFLGPDLLRVQESPEFAKFASAIRSIRAEHGLVGNVYVRDSAFPGILSGKWDAAIKRRCASAAYFLTTPGSKLAAYENYLGKKVVTSVPWGEALNHYRPIIEAGGKRLASGSPQQVLQAAFTQHVAKVRAATNFPTHEVPTVSGVEARKAFAEAPATTREVVARNERVSLVKRADARLERWVRAGLLTALRVNQLRAQIGDPHDLLRTAALEISPAKRAEYLGSGVGAKTRDSSTKRDAAWASGKNAEIQKASLDRAKVTIAKLVKSGSLTPEEAGQLLTSGLEPEILLHKATELATAPKVAMLAKTPEKSYSGPVYKTALTSKRAQDLTPVLPLEVRRLLRWASVQMSEGMAGKDLDYMLSARFSDGLRKQADAPLTQLRKKHEGLAGHLYVEASAYASPAGTDGCEKGALIHRANQLRSVLAMDRCATCTSNVGNHCQKYSKAIVDAVPEKQAAKYQAEMIRLANSDDSERTASLFAPSFDEGEYELQNDNLDDIEFSNAPPVEDLGGILFEGLILDTDEE